MEITPRQRHDLANEFHVALWAGGGLDDPRPIAELYTAWLERQVIEARSPSVNGKALPPPPVVA